jgi:DnaJ family protein C protein 9
MGSILEIVECSTAKDGGRFEKIIREAIKEGTVPVFKGFEKSATPKEHEKRIKKELKEEQEFLKHQEKEKKEEKPSLLALIQKNAQNRQAKMNSIIESIEASSAGDKKGKRKREVKQVDDMPSEEEFLKLQEQLFKKQKK